MDVLSKGLKFAIPPTKVKREEIFTEFESLWSQLEHLTAFDTEAVIACKAKLSDIAQAYCGTHMDPKGFSLTKEHYTAIKRLRQNKDIVICKPDKGSGVMILNRSDYETKMHAILNDQTKFTKLGNLPEYDRTSAIEKSLQKLLSNPKDSNQITEQFYKCVRPTGSERPRM